MHISLDSLLPSAKKLLPSLCVSTMKFYSEEYKSCAWSLNSASLRIKR